VLAQDFEGFRIPLVRPDAVAEVEHLVVMVDDYTDADGGQDNEVTDMPATVVLTVPDSLRRRERLVSAVKHTMEDKVDEKCSNAKVRG